MGSLNAGLRKKGGCFWERTAAAALPSRAVAGVAAIVQKAEDLVSGCPKDLQVMDIGTLMWWPGHKTFWGYNSWGDCGWLFKYYRMKGKWSFKMHQGRLTIEELKGRQRNNEFKMEGFLKEFRYFGPGPALSAFCLKFNLFKYHILTTTLGEGGLQDKRRPRRPLLRPLPFVTAGVKSRTGGSVAVS